MAGVCGVQAAGEGGHVDLAKIGTAIIQMTEGSNEEIEAALMTTYALMRRLQAMFNSALRQILPYIIKFACAKSDKPVKLRIFSANGRTSVAPTADGSSGKPHRANSRVAHSAFAGRFQR